MTDPITLLVTLLSSHRLPRHPERAMQDAIATLLTNAGIAFQREHDLGNGCRVDFFLSDGTALELKQRHSYQCLLRQLKRYSERPEVTRVVLLAIKPVDLPPTLSGKPVSSIAIWQQFLT